MGRDARECDTDTRHGLWCDADGPDGHGDPVVVGIAGCPNDARANEHDALGARGRKRNAPLSDEELNLMIPSEGYTTAPSLL